jgi:hypothetical protein
MLSQEELMKTRRLNGYVVVYRPDHFNVMKSENWKGYVYEHKFIVEQSIGRPLEKDELVHHVNQQRDDNRSENLLLMKKWDHHKRIPRQCCDCKVVLRNRRAVRCYECSCRARRKVQRPDRQRLLSDLEHMSYLAVGRKYGVSDNAIRKWLRSKEDNQ